MATGDKRVVGDLKPVKEEKVLQETSFGVLGNMTEEEANLYMTSLGKNEVDLKGVEKKANEQLKKAFEERSQLIDSASKAQERLEAFGKAVEKAEGKIHALSSLLVSEEDDRRTKKEGAKNGK